MKNVLSVTLLALAISASAPAVSGWGSLVEDVKKTGGELLNQQLSADQAIDNETLLNGLREALAVGSERAVDAISQPGGFLDDAKIRIPLPAALEKLTPILEKAGLGSQIEQFETSMNRAAEKAAPQATALLLNAIKEMSFDDVRRIYEGADDEATRYFKEKLGGDIAKLFSPQIDDALNSVGATRYYSELAGEAKQIPFVGSAVNVDLTDYVTEQAMGGMFLKLAEEERQIRQNPVARTTDLLKQLWGS